METKTYTFAELQERAKNCEWLFFDFICAEHSTLLYFIKGECNKFHIREDDRFKIFLEIPKKSRNENLMLWEIYEQVEDVLEFTNGSYNYNQTNLVNDQRSVCSDWHYSEWTRKNWRIIKRKSDQPSEIEETRKKLDELKSEIEKLELILKGGK